MRCEVKRDGERIDTAVVTYIQFDFAFRHRMISIDTKCIRSNVFEQEKLIKVKNNFIDIAKRRKPVRLTTRRAHTLTHTPTPTSLSFSSIN